MFIELTSYAAKDDALPSCTIPDASPLADGIVPLANFAPGTRHRATSLERSQAISFSFVQGSYCAIKWAQ